MNTRNEARKIFKFFRWDKVSVIKFDMFTEHEHIQAASAVTDLEISHIDKKSITFVIDGQEIKEFFNFRSCML